MDRRLPNVAVGWSQERGASSSVEVVEDSCLTGVQIRIVVLLTIAVGITRLFAAAASPWDWDEMLFSLAVEGDYDVSLHHPHPPGFPVFVALARLLAPGLGTFGALQFVVFCGALALFPLMFLVSQRMGFGFSVSVISGILLSSFPNVVFYGGTAFSDVPALALMLGAIASLLEAPRSRKALLLAAVLGGLALGIRVQSALAFVIPAFFTLKKRAAWDLVFAALLVVVIVGVSYGGAALATGSLDEYVNAVRHHGAYIEAIDSFRNPARPALGRVFERLLRPYRGGDLPGIVLFFAVLAIVDAMVHRYRPVALALGCLGPFLVFAWLMLDVNSISRLSIGYMPLLAVLAARGLFVMGRMLSTWIELSPLIWMNLLGGVLSVAMLAWVWPAVQGTRETPSPPMAAAEWLRGALDRNGTTVWVEAATLEPLTRLELQNWDVRPFKSWSEISLDRQGGRTGYVLLEGEHEKALASFSRRDRTLERLVRDRFFVVSIVQIEDVLRFGPGWYDRETGSGLSWRWMAGESDMVIPASSGARTLELVLEFPSGEGENEFTALLDGREEGLVVARSAEVAKVRVDIAQGEKARHLTLRVERVVSPLELGVSGDSRQLGAKLVSYTFP